MRRFKRWFEPESFERQTFKLGVDLAGIFAVITAILAAMDLAGIAKPGVWAAYVLSGAITIGGLVLAVIMRNAK